MGNLYGTIMSFYYLPYGGFRFLSQEEIKVLNLDSILRNCPIGYILEVALQYCKELNDLHNDYPLSPEKIEVGYDMLSDYCKENLKYYLLLGMKLVKIHKILSFKQSSWLKKYVNFNTEKRKQSPSEFNKSLYK